MKDTNNTSFIMSVLTVYRVFCSMHLQIIFLSAKDYVCTCHNCLPLHLFQRIINHEQKNARREQKRISMAHTKTCTHIFFFIILLFEKKKKKMMMMKTKKE